MYQAVRKHADVSRSEAGNAEAFVIEVILEDLCQYPASMHETTALVAARNICEAAQSTGLVRERNPYRYAANEGWARGG